MTNTKFKKKKNQKDNKKKKNQEDNDRKQIILGKVNFDSLI